MLRAWSSPGEARRGYHGAVLAHRRTTIPGARDAGISSRQHPFAGQILISGANHTRLQITILGDETFTPPTGQGQIELQVDPGTGTFGAPIWTRWAERSAVVSTAP
jgi:hypothetical protein